MSYIYEGMEWAHSYMYVWMSHVWMSLVCGMRNVTHIWNEQCHIYTCEEWGMSLIYEEWEKKKIVTYMEWGMWHIYVRNEECHSYMRNEKKKKLSHIYEDRNVECHICIWGMRNVTHIWGMRKKKIVTYIWGSECGVSHMYMRNEECHSYMRNEKFHLHMRNEGCQTSHMYMRNRMRNVKCIWDMRNVTCACWMGNVANILIEEFHTYMRDGECQTYMRKGMRNVTYIYEKWGMSLIYMEWGVVRRSQDCFYRAFGFGKIFETQWVFKTQKSALLVLWRGVINPALRSLVNQNFSQREKYRLTKFEQLFSEKNHEK